MKAAAAAMAKKQQCPQNAICNGSCCCSISGNEKIR